MNNCPDQTLCLQLISGEASSIDEVAFEHHLEECEVCQKRLDDIFGISNTQQILSPVEQIPEQSKILKEVINRLKKETELQVAQWGQFNQNIPANEENHAIQLENWFESETLPILPASTDSKSIGRLGKIEILRVLGRGGMGVVFEGMDTLLNRLVAVKVLSPYCVSNPEAKNRFMREARAAATIQHENVVAIHMIDESSGMLYLVMQLIQGESLQDRFNRNSKLEFEEVVRLGIQTAKGLAAAHERGLVHRDIKPGNLMIESSKGDVKITDFGLAKQVGLESITEVGHVAGTPAYMSPEQVIDDAVDARSDLFSLGVVLYHASTGKRPFHGDSPFIVLNQIRSETPARPKQINPDLPKWFDDIVMSLLEKKPADRISSANQLAEMLENQNSSASTGSRITRFYFWALILCCLAAALGFAIYQKKTSQPTQVLKDFRVIGMQSSFSTLLEAINAASSDSIIEVHGDGPFYTPSIRIDGKNLTIRAATRHTPKFIPQPTGEKPLPSFLITNSDLALEGLDIHWPINSPFQKIDETDSKGVVWSSTGALRLSHCRILAGTNFACVGSVSQLNVQHCHLISSNQIGSCVGFRLNNSKVRIEGSVLQGTVGLFIAPPLKNRKTEIGSIHLIRNTIQTNRSIHLITEEKNKQQKVLIDAEYNIFDSPQLITLQMQGGFSKSSSPALNQVFRESLTWSDESNLYRKGMNYFGGNKPNSLLMLYYSEVKQLNQWVAFWPIAMNRSVEGAIRYADITPPTETHLPKFTGVDNASGQVPEKAGADVEIVGPGEPFFLFADKK